MSKNKKQLNKVKRKKNERRKVRIKKTGRSHVLLPLQQRKLGLIVKGKSSDIAHVFFDVEALPKQIDEFIEKQNIKIKGDLAVASVFWSWLIEQPIPDKKHLATYTAPLFLYRVVKSDLQPLSVAGSLGSGGRFNLGMVQVTGFEPLSSLTPSCCLYASDTSQCAKAEASIGLPIKTHKLFKLISARSLQLWNLLDILKNLNWPNIRNLIDAQPTSAAWILQKSPAISQLVATWLRNNGGDGLIYPSTKSPDCYVIALFVKDDAEASKLFNAEEVLEDQSTQLSLPIRKEP